MTTIVTRSGKGSPLTHTEVDTNFTNLNTAKLEAGAIALGSAATPSISFTGDTDTGIYSPGANQVAVATNGTQKLIVLSNGNVGIGTSSPSGLLHVQSNLAGNNQIILTNIASSNSGAGSEIVFTQGASGHAAGKIQCDREGAYSATVSTHDSALAFFTAADGVDTERLRITSAGLVGIGTTTPDALLTVNGIGAFGAGAVGTPSISATGDLNTGFWFPAADTIAASTTGSERLRIDSSGRLLVGTSTVPTFRITNDDRTDSTHITTKSGTALGASFAVVQWAGNTAGAWGNDVVFAKSFNGTVGTHTIGSSGSLVSRLFFSASDGTRFVPAASIETFIDGTPGTNDMPGRLVFSSTADGASSPTEAMRINSQQELLVGTATRNANGGVLQLKSGITFPATAVAATDANTLDDYEEGTWTPTLTGWSSITYSVRSGKYTKIGNTVISYFYFTFTGTSSASIVEITGLPFTAASAVSSAMIAYQNMPVSSTRIAGDVNVTTIRFFIDGGVSSLVSNADAVSALLQGIAVYSV